MQSDINRRGFIKQSSVGSLGLMFIPSLFSESIFHTSTSSSNSAKISMSGITPVSVIENACMLAFCSGKLSQDSENAITTDIHLRDTPGNKGRLAVHLPPGNEKIIDLINRIMEDKSIKYPAEKRAIAFGWAAVNAVENNINSAMQGNSESELRKKRLHQDALVINGFSKGLNIQNADPADVEALLNTMLTRTLTRIHTLKPDNDDGIGWVNRITAWRKQNVDRMEGLANAIVKPDESIAGVSFYNHSDKIINTAIKLQNGAFVSADQTVESLQPENAKCDYAKALAEAVESIVSIDYYLNGNLNETEIRNQLQV